MEIRQKIFDPWSCLLRSLEVIGIDTDRSAAYDFRLVFRSNQGHISYRLRDKRRRFTSKMASFPHPRLFNAPAEGVAPWNFVTAAKVMPLPDGGKSLICAFVSIQYQSVTDGRTDGFATTISRSACLRTLKRDKNSRTYACFSFTKTKTRTA